MTAETLKPFITPTSAVNNFPAKQSGTKRKTRQLIPIILSIVALVLVAGILILTVGIYNLTCTLKFSAPIGNTISLAYH